MKQKDVQPKEYVKPELVIYGDLQAITGHYGPASASDTIYLGGFGSIPGAGGSVDAGIVPCPGSPTCP